MVIAKPREVPRDVARTFFKAMRDYFAEGDAIKRDEIAARQLHALGEHQGPREKKLRLSDVKEMAGTIATRFVLGCGALAAPSSVDRAGPALAS